MNALELSFYGDDFTGSTDVMECLCLHGVETVLFLEPPSAELLEKRFPGAKAVGVAGVSRSLNRDEMERELRGKFESLRTLNTPFFHYKVCSTFDSAPEVGSIGLAIEIGMEVFGSTKVPLVIGAPRLKRYVAFGNLFAAAGEEAVRLDRHPTMGRHPVTPMDESDIRLHLAKQTDQPIDLVDCLALEGDEKVAGERYDAIRDGIVLFDTITNSHLPLIGRLLDEGRSEGGVQYVVGSSGLEYCLGAHWLESGKFASPKGEFVAKESELVVAMCGSASPATSGQIEYALDQGYYGIRLDGRLLIDDGRVESEIERCVSESKKALRDGKSVVLYLARGPEDPAIEETRTTAREKGVSMLGHRLGEAQGRILKRILETSGLRRACVAGGDTSGYVSKELGIFALEMAASIAPGGPLCKASSDDPAFDGIEIALKGGQVGVPQFFEQVRRGRV